jgi:hypothetical protein
LPRYWRDSHHYEGEHDKRDMAMPAMPQAGLVMIEAEFVLGCLQAIFDFPTVTFDGYERLNACSARAPGREECEVAIADIAPDQQATRPKPGLRLAVPAKAQLSEKLVFDTGCERVHRFRAVWDAEKANLPMAAKVREMINAHASSIELYHGCR